ncbi:MAG: hypothetical protein AAB490_01300 [Patescibacteria group bacterium]
MQKKNLILVASIVTLVLASALLLYRSFSQRPIAFITKQASDQDSAIRNQVEQLKIKITSAVKVVDTGGKLDELLQSEQYQALTDDSIRDIVVGQYGRQNPFVPPTVSP